MRPKWGIHKNINRGDVSRIERKEAGRSDY